jgi:ribosomal protein L18
MARRMQAPRTHTGQNAMRNKTPNRNEIAKAAMVAIIANRTFYGQIIDECEDTDAVVVPDKDTLHCRIVASFAYDFADAMVEASRRKPGKP